MTNKSLWHPALGKGLLLGALLAVAVPAIAFANTMSITVKTPGATNGPTTTNSEIKSHGDCANGTLISGGGINQAIGTGTSSNGNHVNGTVPSANGTGELTGTPGVVATDVTHWMAIGGSGGAVNSSFSTTPYALCFSSNLINHTQVVMNSQPVLPAPRR
ncbi:MAG: hypothetical protein ACRDTJ_18210 [Pseudonocardiaceae bacterium]